MTPKIPVRCYNNLSVNSSGAEAGKLQYNILTVGAPFTNMD